MINRLICPACQYPDGKNAYVINGFSILRCGSCKTLYVRDIPDRVSLDKIYTDSDYYDLEPQSAKRVMNEHLRRLKIIGDYANKGRILDVGCANGVFLDCAKSDGFETFGIEISPRNVSIAYSKGHNVFLGSLEEYSISNPKERFQIITCLDVIEHVESPLNFIKLLSEHLLPDGMLLISTPNYSGVVAKLLGKRDVFLTPPEHLNFFTIQGLLLLAKQAELSCIYKTTFGNLTENELERVILRHFPKSFKMVNPILKFGIQQGFNLLNAVKVGLEMEVYFKKMKD